MWIILAIASALGLGFYDISKKLSLKDNNVPAVLLLNTLFCALLMLPVVAVKAAGGNWGMNNSLAGHGLILIKSMIVLSSWLMGYFSIKHLPLTIAGPINASRPVMVLVGALLIFRRTSQPAAVGRRGTRFFLALLYQSSRRQGRVLIQAQQMALDEYRRGGYGSCQRLIRQVSASTLRAA